MGWAEKALNSCTPSIWIGTRSICLVGAECNEIENIQRNRSTFGTIPPFMNEWRVDLGDESSKQSKGNCDQNKWVCDHKLNCCVHWRLHRQSKLTIYRIVYGNAYMNVCNALINQASSVGRQIAARILISLVSMECKHSLSSTLQSYWLCRNIVVCCLVSVYVENPLTTNQCKRTHSPDDLRNRERR